MGASRAGRVVSFREVSDGGKGDGGEDVASYGPIRTYEIKFGNEQLLLTDMTKATAGSVIDGIPEHVVVSKRDYLLSTSHGVAHEWKGVRNVVDKFSDDLWAKYVGWYAAVIWGGGETDAERFFPRLSDAINAYDTSVVRIKGFKTKPDDLNIPENWDWLFTTNGNVEHDKNLLPEQLDDVYKRERELAVKMALDEERLKHLNMQIKLRMELRESYDKEMAATKKIHDEVMAFAVERARADMLLHHHNEKERLRAELKEHYEAVYKRERELAVKMALDEERLKHLNMQIKLREELRESYDKEMAATKKIHDEVMAFAVERARADMLLHHHNETEQLRAELKEHYDKEKTKAVEEAKAGLRREMQLAIDHEKELRKKMELEICHEKDMALHWLHVKVMEKQRQQQQRKLAEAGAQGLDPTNKSLVRARDGGDEMLAFMTRQKRVKLVGNESDSNCVVSVSREVSLTTNREEIKQVESPNLENVPIESSPLLSSNGSSSEHSKPFSKELAVVPLAPPVCLSHATQTKSKMLDGKSPSKFQTADDDDRSNELGGHHTAVEALLFAAERVESRKISAESMTAGPSIEEFAPTATSSKLTSLVTSKKKNRHGRILDESKTIEPADDDVLLGRGGYVNIHPGNIKFREKALELRPWYESSTKEEKYNISKVLIESVRGKGHRFLEKGSDGLWHEVSGNGVRKKASQSLRERVREKMIISTPSL
ncbi:hypothetical protein ACHAXA_005072 [Cyclostephanos tholiformis]|uniref:DUF6824 domain-containing protein n=1 Tax=Cyclostephanos tholiformis TaxID=382380 RepID=A0ABD3SSF1_9STRA